MEYATFGSSKMGFTVHEVGDNTAEVATFCGPQALRHAVKYKDWLNLDAVTENSADRLWDLMVVAAQVMRHRIDATPKDDRPTVVTEVAVAFGSVLNDLLRPLERGQC